MTLVDDTRTVRAHNDEHPLPQGAQLSPLDATFRNDPYSVLGQLRSAAPVHWDPDFARWFVTGADQIRSILRNGNMSSNPQTALPGSFSEMFANGVRNAGMEILLESMLWQDDPQHRPRAAAALSCLLKQHVRFRPFQYPAMVMHNSHSEIEARDEPARHVLTRILAATRNKLTWRAFYYDR